MPRRARRNFAWRVDYRRQNALPGPPEGDVFRFSVSAMLRSGAFVLIRLRRDIRIKVSFAHACVFRLAWYQDKKRQGVSSGVGTLVRAPGCHRPVGQKAKIFCDPGTSAGTSALLVQG